jgi:hypothetical protein
MIVTDLLEMFEKIGIDEPPGSLMEGAVHSDNITLSMCKYWDRTNELAIKCTCDTNSWMG